MFAGTGGTRVSAMDLATGKQVWTRNLPRTGSVTVGVATIPGYVLNIVILHVPVAAAVYNISTAESLGLIVEMFCSDIFKPTEVSLIYSLLSNSPVSTKEIIIELINKQKNSDYQIADYNRLMTEYYESNIKTKN